MTQLIDGMMADLSQLLPLNLTDDEVIAVSLNGHRGRHLQLHAESFVRVAKQLNITELVAWDFAPDQMRFLWSGWTVVACGCDLYATRQNGFTITIKPT